MRDFFILTTQRVLKIVIISAIACAIGFLAGHNDTGVSTAAPQQPVAAPHAGKAAYGP
jgi:hypothetical protein